MIPRRQHRLQHVVAGLVALLCRGFDVAGFVERSQHPVRLGHVAFSGSALSAVLPPPMIIGPMLKKMKEENEKKKMPMADAGEAANQAPGLRVGRNAWKWPPVWPYDAGFFKPAAEIAAMQNQMSMNSMASMLSGVALAPTGGSESAEDETKFNPLKFWGEEKATETTDMDPDAEEKLKAHYSYYLQDGMSILELGAAEKSYLPDGLKLRRHVGVSANQALMKQNPTITETLIVDLNKVIPDRDVDNDDFRRLAQEPFDAIIMANTVNYLTNPREVFRSAWYLLKPGGIMIASFGGKEAFAQEKFSDAVTKMWRDYNDDQHMWITGSFFQFSASEGWESLLGFDISPASARDMNAGPLDILKGGKANNMYVVQAMKGYQDVSINEDNIERSVRSLCWMLPVLEERDKDLLVPRLTRAIETAEEDHVKAAIEKNIQFLPKVYEVLAKMDQFAFTYSMQSQIAADLICDPDFEANEEQMMALRQGLGLRAPSKNFWVPIGENTAAMLADDKISLLGYIVPRFGSGNPLQEAALQTFVSGLKPTYAVIRAKCPKFSESDVQLVGAELLAAELLKPGLTTRQEFASWLAAFTEKELTDILNYRKSIREDAKEDLAAYRKAREEEKARLEEYRKLMDEQIQKAREERSLIFNPKTQKMEIFNNPSRKK